MDIAVVGAGVFVQRSPDGEHLSALRLALGAVAPTAVEVDVAHLVGHPMNDDTLRALAEAARAACKPIDDKRGTAGYRVRVAGVLAQRAARIAWARSQGAAA